MTAGIVNEHQARLDLPVEGMTCAACAARIERGLSRLDGVSEASVNFATNRATVVYDPEQVDRAGFVRKIEDLGYAVAAADESEQDAHDEHTRDLGRRLSVAALCTVPLVAISMIPALQFDRWPWVAFALATPVVAWSAWPFHRATFTNLRHGAVTMDTLVSLGTGAAYLWSVVVLFLFDVEESMSSMGAWLRALPRP